MAQYICGRHDIQHNNTQHNVATLLSWVSFMLSVTNKPLCKSLCSEIFLFYLKQSYKSLRNNHLLTFSLPSIVHKKNLNVIWAYL
jgi:hypothetical protein